MGFGDWFDKTFISGDSGKKNQEAGKAQAAIDKSQSDSDKYLQQQAGLNGTKQSAQTADISNYMAANKKTMDQQNADDQSFYGNVKGDAARRIGEVQGTEGKYQSQQGDALQQSKDQMKQAGDQWNNTSGNYDQSMQGMGGQIAGAMTLQDAQNPDNAVAKSYRQSYENQAQGEGKQGLADFGALSALGAQASGNAMGNAPMSIGQQVAMMGANQRQAGQAYTNTQQRMQSLRDQGRTVGMQQSDAAYNRGTALRDQMAGITGQKSNAYNQYFGQQNSGAATQQGIYGNMQQSGQRLNDATDSANADVINTENGVNQAKTGRQSNYDSQGYTLNQGAANDAYNQNSALINARMGRTDTNTQQSLGQIQSNMAQIQTDLNNNRGALGAGASATGAVAGKLYDGPANKKKDSTGAAASGG